MKTTGQTFPNYDLVGVASSDASDAFGSFQPASSAGRWRVFVFYPKDFTFVCPTELVGFGELQAEFDDRDADLFGVSTDSEYVHLAWRQHHEGVGGLPYPLLSDLKRELSEELGVLDDEGVARRATYIVDPEGFIRYASVHDGSVGRNPAEVLRVLDALQTDELCPCNWQKGDATLEVA